MTRTNWLGALFAGWALSIASGCARELEGEDPPLGAVYFPISATVAPTQRFAYVQSSNFDLRFNTGWLSVVDLEAMLAGDESPIVGQLKIPPLGGGMALSPSGSFLLTTHRSDKLLALVKVATSGDELTCGDADAEKGLTIGERRTDCDSAHLVHLEPDTVHPDLEASDFNDPYGVAFVPYDVPGGGSTTLAAVSYLGVGQVTLFEVASGLTHVSSGSTEPALVLREGRPDGATDGFPRVLPLGARGPKLDDYLRLRRENEDRIVLLGEAGVGELSLVSPAGKGPFLIGASQRLAQLANPRSTVFSIDLAGALAEDEDAIVRIDLRGRVGGAEIAGLAPSADGTRMVAANRFPDSLVWLDTTVEPLQLYDTAGAERIVERPRFTSLASTTLDGRPAGVVVLPRPDGSEWIATVGFDDGALYLLAPESERLTVIARLDGMGDGPFELVHATPAGRDVLLVLGFFSHTVTLVDVSAAAATDAHVVATLEGTAALAGGGE